MAKVIRPQPDLSVRTLSAPRAMRAKSMLASTCEQFVCFSLKLLNSFARDTERCNYSFARVGEEKLL
jgi:hypothetical protein